MREWGNDPFTVNVWFKIHQQKKLKTRCVSFFMPPLSIVIEVHLANMTYLLMVSAMTSIKDTTMNGRYQRMVTTKEGRCNIICYYHILVNHHDLLFSGDDYYLSQQARGMIEQVLRY
jgi:hypothetical protein